VSVLAQELTPVGDIVAPAICLVLGAGAACWLIYKFVEWISNPWK
jgi:hypothetical protein